MAISVALRARSPAASSAFIRFVASRRCVSSLTVREGAKWTPALTLGLLTCVASATKRKAGRSVRLLLRSYSRFLTFLRFTDDEVVLHAENARNSICVNVHQVRIAFICDITLERDVTALD